jgi:hypothetical protein
VINRRHAKYAVAIMAVAFVVMAAAYSYNLATPKQAAARPEVVGALPPSIGVGGGVQPRYQNVSVIGTLKVLRLAPACSLQIKPCSTPASQIFYVVVNGRNYRLIPPFSMNIPESLTGSSVVVSGLYVTPSTFQADQWVPPLFFFGDIYVRTIWYFRAY